MIQGLRFKTRGSEIVSGLLRQAQEFRERALQLLVNPDLNQEKAQSTANVLNQSARHYEFLADRILHLEDYHLTAEELEQAGVRVVPPEENRAPNQDAS